MEEKSGSAYQKLCNLYGVERCALAYLVAYYPEVESVINGKVLADAANVAGVAVGGLHR